MKAFLHFFLILMTTGAFALGADSPPANSLFSSVFERPAALDPIVIKYWGNYAGPPVNDPGNATTTSVTGQARQVKQNADDLLTLGYQVNPSLRPGIGMPFNFVPFARAAAIQIKPLYFGLVDFRLLEAGPLTIHGDARIYTPIGDVARSQDVQTGFRTSQVAILHVPGSKWTVGTVSYFRVWQYGENGKGFRNDLELYLSFLANYPLTGSLDFTLWSDWLQLGHQFQTPAGLKNLPIDVQPGIRWNVSQAFNINPYVNFIPGNLRWDTVNLGLVVNARLL